MPRSHSLFLVGLSVGMSVALGAGCGALSGDGLAGSGGSRSTGSGGVATGTGGQGGIGGGADGGFGFCNTDSDCILESVGCCGETCAAKTDPVTREPATCNVACPISIFASCGCVNHQCSFGTGSGGQGGGGQGGAASGGSSGSSDGGASCGDLATQYASALRAAQSCDVNATGQCQSPVSSSLSPCFTNCMTYVNDPSTLNGIKAIWEQAGCNNVLVLCPAIACLQPTAGVCVASDGGTGVCSSKSIATTN